MKEKLQQIKEEAARQIQASRELSMLDDVRAAFLGKRGELTAVLKGMKNVLPEERPIVGQLVNETRAAIEEMLEETKKRLEETEMNFRLKQEVIDVTLPARRNPMGHRHPVKIVLEEAERIFIGMGYEAAEGRIAAPGRVFWPEGADAAHALSFHQFEGMAIDKDITFADLKGTLTEFAKELFGGDIKVRFRPGCFPHTEPGAGMDAACFQCGGRGCRFCKGSGWIEIFGGGMIRPEVLKTNGIDPKVYSGFAFRAELEGLAMLKYEIDDIRLLYENDDRFLSQF